MPRSRKILFAVVGLAAALLFIVVGGRLILASRSGQTFVTERLLNLINLPGQTIAIANTGGAWPAHILLSGITVSDREGVWLTIDHLTLDWHPAKLLRREVVIDAVTAATMTVVRAPVANRGGGTVATFDLDGVVRSVRDVHVNRLAVKTLVLAPSVLGDAATITVTGSLRDQDGGKKASLSLERSDAPGHAHLTAQADARALNIRLNAATEGITALADISAARPDSILSGTFRLERSGDNARGYVVGTLSGTEREPSLLAEFDVTNLSVAARLVPRLAGTIRTQRTQSGIYTLTGEGTVADVRRAVPELAPITLPEASWSVNGSKEGDALALEKLEIMSGDTNLTVTGGMTGGAILRASATLRVRGLGRLAGVINDTSLTTGVLTATHVTTAGVGEGTLRVTANHLPNGLPELNASARWNADENALRIGDFVGLDKDIKLTGASIWPRRAGKLDHGTTHMAITAQATRVGFASGAPLVVTADFTGPLASLTGQIQARSTELNANGETATDLVAKLSLAPISAGYEVKLDTHAMWRGAPATVTVQATTTNGADVTATLHAASVAGFMDGNIKFDTRSGLAAGTLSARLDDIRPLADAFGIDAAGMLEASATLSSPDTAQRAEVKVKIKDFVSNPISAQTISLTAQVDDVRRDRRFQVNLTAAEGKLADRPLTKLSGRASGMPSAYDVDLEAVGANQTSPLLALRARVLDTDTTTITFTRLAADDGLFSAALISPTTVTISPQKIVIESLVATIAGGRLTGNVAVARDAATIAADFTVQGVSANVLAPARFSLPVGKLEGRINISGPLKNAAATLHISAAFSPDAISATPAFNLVGDARISGGRMEATAAVEGFSAKPAALSIQMPLSLDLSGPRINVDMDAPMTAAASWNGNIAPLWRLLPQEDHLLSGEANLDVQVAGTPGAPQIAGGVKITGGRYENIPAGIVLRNVALALETQRGVDLTVTMAATDAGRGRISASGRVDRDAGGSWTADLTADLDRLAVLARDEVTAAASGKMTYRGPLLAGILQGNLAVVRASVHLDSTGVPEVPLLRSFAELKADTFDVLAPDVPPAPITLDLSLSMAEPLTVEGRGLQSAWRGDLYVKGSISEPDVVGRLILERGIFGFLGQTFELESGIVTFTGGGRIDPQLSLVAVREVTDVTATVNITGTAAAPTITLSSRPMMPQDEVLARLMFNRNTGELGPLESIQLASAAADMSGIARGGISGVVKRSLHLDTFGFGGQSGNAVVAGRQISRNIFVSVEQNVDNTSRLFTITWRLTRHFSLRSSARDQSGANLGLFWRKDY